MSTPRDGVPLSLVAALGSTFLRRHGLLYAERDATLKVQWLRFATGKIELAWNAATLELLVRGGQTEVAVRVVSSREDKWSPVFVCPLDGQSCSTLYLLQGRWGSMRAHRLSYPSRQLSVEDHRDVAAGLRVKERYRPNDPVVTEPATNHQNPRSSRRLNPLGTEAAIVAGRKVWREKHLPVFINTWRSLLDERPSVEKRSPSPFSKAKRVIWEDLPVLELNVLIKNNLVPGDRPTVALLFYGILSQGLEDCGLFIEPGNPVEPHIDIVFRASRSEPRLTSVQLTIPKAGERQYMICPISGSKVDALGFRSGVWGSRDALRAENASQRSATFRTRMARRLKREASLALQRNIAAKDQT
jgi:hypothetical protein